MIIWYRLYIVNGVNDLTGRLVSLGQPYSYNRLIIVWQLNERFARISVDIRYSVLVDSAFEIGDRSATLWCRNGHVCFLTCESPPVSRVPCNFQCIINIGIRSGCLQIKLFSACTVRVSFDTLWMLTRSVQRFLVCYIHRLTMRFRAYRY